MTVEIIEVKTMKNLWYVFLVLLIASQAVKADNKNPNDPNELLRAKWEAVIKDPNDLTELLQVKWDAVVKVLQAKEIDQESKEKIIDNIVSPVFDFPLMCKLALGKTNWSKLTPSQRKEFSQLFVGRLKDAYRDKIVLYNDEKASIGTAIQKKKMVHVPMVLVSSEKNITILYMLHKVKNGWKIYDFEIQGVSIILTYRSQFIDMLSHGSFEELISQLEKPTTP